MFRTAILDSNNNSSVHSPSHNSSNGGSSQSPTKYSDFVRTSYVAEKQTFHDMNVDPTRTYLNTISQDRMIREYSIKDGKKIRQFRGSLNEDGYLVKMDIDRTGQLMATACTDKIVYIWDMKSTECLAYLYGHSENINDLKFTNDGQYLITVGADGCLFTWRITNLYSYLTNQAPNSMVHSQSVNSLSTSRNMLRQSISMPMSNLTNGTIQPAPVPSVNNLHCPEKLTASTMEIPSILADTDSDECLPAWARKKLDDNANNVTTNMASTSRSSWATSTGALDLDSLAGSRRSGRAVWGQQINTSFAVAVDSELNSLASQPSMPSEVQEDPASTTSTPPNKSLHKNLNCIQFPSPCVNKDSYQVKQVSIEHKQVKNGASQRPSWICSNNEDDILFNMNRSGDSSGDDIDTPGSPVKADEDDVGECEPAEASDDLATKATADKCNSEANVEEKEATVDFNIAPLSFDSEYAKLMHDIPPCLNTPIRRQQPPTDKTCMSLGGTTGVDQNPIKLNCDMENSFRRSASISARYLLRTAAQQQKESQQNDMPNDSASTQIDPTLTPIKSASKPEKESNLSEAINQLTKNEAPVLEPVSEKMQPPPVPTPTMANEFKIRTRSRASVGGANFQLLYSHHTESSLSKAKPKQPQQFHSSNNLSKDVSTSENNKANASILSHQMKRSPSVNSITISVSQCDSKSQESSSSIASSSATSSTSSIKHSSNKSTSSAAQSAKSSPSRQSSTILNRSNTLDIHHTNTNETQTKPGRHSINVSTTSSATNLKKASSMVALNQGPSTKVRNKSTTQAHPLTKDPTQSQFLPPKTVRQVKQRSADRQLTTGAIASQPSTTKPTLTSFSNFAEQNKHLRKLSSSIQNLHHQSSAKTPTPAVKSPTSISIKTEPEPIPIKKPPTETNKTLANNPSNNSSNQLDLMNKLKKIDADQMSLSSSSVECLGQNDNDPIQLNTLDNDLDLLPNQPHSSSHTSNSLTSSSSSSCSLFESNTNQSNEPNELKSADLNEDEDKECYKTLSESQQQSNSRLCSADLDSSGVFNLNSFASTISSLKKPVTFASISKSKSANSSPNIISYTNPSKFNINSQSNNGGGSFSNSKVDSIRSEFFQNVKNLQFVLSQGSKNLDDYLKIYQKPTHHQQLKCLLTDQANQQIQHQIHSFVKQLNAVASLNNANESNSSVVANTTATTNNSTNTNIINSEEIELA